MSIELFAIAIIVAGFVACLVTAMLAGRPARIAIRADRREDAKRG
jgi:hypothetical protein